MDEASPSRDITVLRSGEDSLASRRIGFVGAGRVGTTLARALRLSGLNVVISSRDRARVEAAAAGAPGLAVAESAQAAVTASDLMFLTLPDDAITTVCAALSWRPQQAVVHCSGAAELLVLQAASRQGAMTGAFHPLQMFANPAVALETLSGCTVTIDAEPPLDARLTAIADRLRCRSVRLPPGQRVLYHASAYYVGPFLVALMREAAHIWRALGMNERETLAALVPLLQGTVAAVLDGGLAQGMGGCVARGDAGTVQRHLEALDEFSPAQAALYRQLARRTIPLAVERGTLSAERAERIGALLDA